MSRTAAGLVVCRRAEQGLEVLLVHPGGPFFKRRDDGVWSIPKGLVETGETGLVETARREFEEETGFRLDADARLESLGSIRQKGGKTVHGFATEGDFDVTLLSSNPFELEWPRGSGRIQRFPEVDRADWFAPATARVKIVAAQWPLVERAIAWFRTRPLAR